MRDPVADSLRRFYYDTVTHDPAATVRAAGIGSEAEAAILEGNLERLVG